MNKLFLNNLNVNKFYFNNKNINKLYLNKNLIYNNEMPEISDLVALGILSKPISEFTNDDIGTEVLIPYTDAGGVISGPIIFEVVGVNHHTSEEHQQTISLMTKNIIRCAAFDAIEPNNPDSDRSKYGNNRWSVSNIRQWLNSSGAANSWFSPQHEYDAAPNATNVAIDESGAGAYADEPGFLAGFSPEVLQHFTDITNITAVPNIDGGGSETTVDKVFLPSKTEMAGSNTNGIAEGMHLSLRYPNINSRIKIGALSYWMRSPYLGGIYADNSYMTSIIFEDGAAEHSGYAYGVVIGIAPLVVLH